MTPREIITSTFPFAEFFPAGRIIPQRILKGPRRLKHKVVFSGDSWAIPTRSGYVIAVSTDQPSPRSSAVTIAPVWPVEKNIMLRGSPYCQNGSTHWIGDMGNTPQGWADHVARIVAAKNQGGQLAAFGAIGGAA